MNIQPAYVSYEQAKLLKKKGFNLLCFYYYENKILKEPYLENGSSTDTEFKVNLSDLREYFNKHSELISAPEQWQVVEWLRLNHGIWVYVSPYHSRPDDNKTGKWLFESFEPEVSVIKDQEFGKELQVDTTDISRFTYNTPQEAYSAAFDYILKELI
jgi:hypothetical protein